MSLPLPSVRWPAPPSGAPLSWRDTALLDLARHAARKAAMPLGTIEADTRDLWDALKAKASEMGIEPNGDPASVLDAMETYALAWAVDRVSQEVTPCGLVSDA